MAILATSHLENSLSRVHDKILIRTIKYIPEADLLINPMQLSLDQPQNA